MLTKALSYLENGFSILPTGTNKRPLLKTWSPLQKNPPTPDDVKRWFSEGEAQIAVITGGVSGNLEILDFDGQGEQFNPWAEIIRQENPGLYKKLIIERSPSGGFHVAYWCSDFKIPGNSKLSQKGIEVPGPGEFPYKEKTLKAVKHGEKWFIVAELIETRGEGGYCLVAPSAGYTPIQGSLCSLPTVTASERALLVDTARSLNEWINPAEIDRERLKKPRGSSEGLLPGQDFDERGDVAGVLERHGWQRTGRTGVVNGSPAEYWRRPGKNNGHSATVIGGKTLFVFSSNAAPFEPGRAYTPFAVYAILEHEGDFKKASATLGKEGYGTRNDETGKGNNSAPSMGDLREYLEFCVTPGQKISVDEICRGLNCYKRDERRALYVYIGRLCGEGVLKKDEYRHGGYRKTTEFETLNLGGGVNEGELMFNVQLPLGLNGLITLNCNQLLQVSGRYDAGKSSFLFHVMANNYQDHKIIHIVSDEWSLPAIKQRMDVLSIPRPHKNIQVYPMRQGYEDLIPSGPCIVLIDYIRANQNPFETDAQIQRILRNLDGGIAIFATQKHPGLDRPVGGQFAVHASHHVLLLDRWKKCFVCKIYRSKNDRNFEGLYRTFNLDKNKRLFAVMQDWKRGDIKWDKEPGNANKANKANNFVVSKGGGAPVYKENYKEKEKKEPKKRKRNASMPKCEHSDVSEHLAKTVSIEKLEEVGTECSTTQNTMDTTAAEYEHEPGENDALFVSLEDEPTQETLPWR